MNVSNIRLLLKTRNRYDVTLIIFSIISLSLPFFNFESTKSSLIVQWSIVATLLVAAAFLQVTNQVGIKIPAFEYNLKLISHQQIKFILVLKCSLYATAIYCLITSFLVFNPLVLIGLKIILIFHVMLSSVSRSLEGYELGVLGVFSALAIKLPFLVLISMYIVYFMSNRKIKLDFTGMYKLSLVMNAVMLKTSSDITYKQSGKKSKVLSLKFNKLTLFCSKIISSLWYLVIPLVLLLVVVKFMNNSVYIVMLLIGATRILLDKLTNEDLRLYRSKVIPKKVFKSLYTLDVLIYGLYMLLSWIILLLLFGLSLKWFIVITVTTIYFIVLTPKEMSGTKLMIIDSLLIMMLSFLVII